MRRLLKMRRPIRAKVAERILCKLVDLIERPKPWRSAPASPIASPPAIE
jgi:hypothetical protein